MHPDTDERHTKGPEEALAWLDDLLALQNLEKCSCPSGTSVHRRRMVLFCIKCRQTLCEAKKSEHRHGHKLLHLRKIFRCVTVSAQDIGKVINVRNVQVSPERDTIHLNRQTPSFLGQCMDCSLLSNDFYCSIYCKRKQASLELEGEPEEDKPVEPEGGEPVEPEGKPEGREPVEPEGKPEGGKPVEPEGKPEGGQPVEPEGKPEEGKQEGEPEGKPEGKPEASSCSQEERPGPGSCVLKGKRSRRERRQSMEAGSFARGTAEGDWFYYRPGCPYAFVDLEAKTAALKGKRVLSTDSLETVYIKTMQ